MPRKRNPVGIAAGKLILAIQKEGNGIVAEADAALARKVVDRAHVLLQASESSSVPNLLDGRTVVEYLNAGWVERHPSVKPHIEAFDAAVSTHARSKD
jgi:hypothetical protein